MANGTTSTLLLPSGSKEQPYMLMKTTKSPQKNHNASDGPVAIFWDIENCPVPSDVCPEDVAGNVRMALRLHPMIKGAVHMFSAYGDFSGFPRHLREGCQRTGIKLIDVPNGRKDAADKAILVDIFLFALDNPSPSSIMLISGDVDFSPALHVLGQRGYTVILVVPSGVGVSSALNKAGSYVWEWSTVVRGEGFMPSEEEAIVYQEISTTSQSSSENDTTSVQPRDLNNLKDQLVKLLEAFGGHLPLARLHSEYLKSFGRPLCVSEYGTSRLGKLLKKLSDVISVEGEGLNKFASIRGEGFGLKEKEAIVCQEISMTSQSSSENGMMSVQPGDLTALKGQLVKLLEASGGHLPLVRLPSEYLKSYGQPLCVSKYGTSKLINLLKKLSDVISVEGEGTNKFASLRETLYGCHN